MGNGTGTIEKKSSKKEITRSEKYGVGVGDVIIVGDGPETGRVAVITKMLPFGKAVATVTRGGGCGEAKTEYPNVQIPLNGVMLW